MRFLGAEWGPANEAFEHDGADRPPVAAERVAMTCENFGGDIIWGTNRRIGQHSTGFTPGIDLFGVAHRQINLIEGDGIAVLLLFLRVFVV